MRLRFCAPLGVAVLLSLPAISAAQTATRPLELSVDLGAGSFVNGVRNGQTAREVGGAVTWRPFTGAARRIGLELKLARVRHDEGAIGQSNYNHLDAWAPSGSAVLHFRPDAATQPYLVAGIGSIKASAANTRESESGSDIATVFAVGFKARAGKHVLILGEFRDVNVVRATYQNKILDGGVNRGIGAWDWTSINIGVGWRF